ncbi:NB-ARC domain-containing protein [Actinoallomurus sp. NBC_01490]|uniref:AfsR/SARP family transcriptional regulator n=1 Tax=Actinoallomurus sp. NBC_01490 TaxID=2903557 RepID=UPI002E37D7F4|nr:BTAD domain-containing putative transcriptional regulator [Actinoallomurus sp. NBC_01490]
MRFEVLGPLAVLGSGGAVDLGPPKARALLAVLLRRPGRVVAGDVLVEALWGDDPPKSAAKNVQAYVHQLRRRLGDPGRIVHQHSGYLLRAGRDELDVARFDDLVEAARAVEAGGEPERASDLLRDALALWRGEAYSGMADIPIVAAEAARLAEARLSALAQRVDVDIRLGRHAELVGELTALAGEHPLREWIWAQLMLALYRCGRRADALQAYLRARDALVEQIGLEPGRELRDLHEAILTGAPFLDLPAAPGATGARITAPWEPDSPVAAAPRMLPGDIGDFTGYDAELTGIDAVLRGDRAPDRPTSVVAVTGEGGIGKTTVAVRAAHRLRTAYPGGQLFAALGGARSTAADPYEVLGRFLRALGMPDAAVPGNEDERAAAYRSLLADRRVLVVLDDARDERQVERLLPGSGTCAVIVTGRPRLGGLAGAHRIDLGGLPDADGEALLRTIAGRGRIEAEPAETKRLLELCAGLPLALRIVGSQLATRPHWKVGDLVARLADPRHRLDGLRHRGLEVRASFGLGYGALAAPARRLFRLLGLLDTPDFPVWTAAALVNTTPPTAQDLLDDLVDVRLLRVTISSAVGGVRYGFHELVRIYARERAEVEEPAESRRAALARARTCPPIRAAG